MYDEMEDEDDQDKVDAKDPLDSIKPLPWMVAAKQALPT